MRTVTFYSYKGGTGRTLLLANVAIFAARLGHRVVAIDLDLEAPGLPYKLLQEHPMPRSEGVVGWMRDRFALDERPASFIDYVLDVPVPDPFRAGGWLKLMPAGRAPSLNYFQDLIALRLDERLGAGSGVDAFLDLQQGIATDLEPDLLMLDARTGISSTNRVTTRVLADTVVTLTLDNNEQLDGTRSVLRSLTPLTSLRTEEPLELHVVLSRVAPRSDDASTALSDPERAQVDRVEKYLREPAEPLRSTLTVNRVRLIHTEPRLVRGDFLALARTRVYDALTLHHDYLRIAEEILGETVGQTAVAALDSARTPEEREEVARFFAQPHTAAEAVSERLGRDAGRTVADASRGESTIAERVERARQHAARDPARRFDLVVALVEWVIALREVGDLERALDAAEEAVSVARAVAETTDQVVNTGLPGALNALGAIRGALGDYDGAVDAAQESISLLRSLEDIRSGLGTAELAATLDNLARYLGASGHDDEALAAEMEAVELWRRLQPGADADQIQYFGSALIRMARRLNERSDHDAAANAAREAVALFRGLRSVDHVAATEPLANALDELALITRDAEPEAASEALEEAVSLYRELLAQRKTDVMPQLATALNALGLLRDRRGDEQGAAVALEESIRLWREASTGDAAEDGVTLAVALANSARLALQGDRFGEAISAFEEALDIRRRAFAADPEHELAFVRMLLEVGLALSAAGQARRAIDLTEEAVGRLRDRPTRERRLLLATSLNSLGILYSQVSDDAKARAATAESVEIWQGLAAADPTLRGAYLQALLNLVADNVAMGDLTAARAAVVDASKVAGDFADEQPAVAAELGGVALVRLALVDALEGSIESAVIHADEAVRLFTSHGAAPSAANRDDIVAVLAQLARLLGDAPPESKPADARERVEKLLAKVAELGGGD